MRNLTQFKKPKNRKRNLKKPETNQPSNNDTVITTTDPTTIHPKKEEEETTIKNEETVAETTTTKPPPHSDSDDDDDDINNNNKNVSSSSNNTNTSRSSSSTLLRIQSIKNNRRLKSLQRRIATEANTYRTTTQKSRHPTEEINPQKQNQHEGFENEAKKVLQQRLEGTFSTNNQRMDGGSRRRSNNNDDDHEEEDVEEGDQGTIQRKHKLAMEQYIQNQMEGKGIFGTTSGDDTEQRGDIPNNTNNSIQDQSDLYAQLIREAATMGTSTTSDTKPSSTSQTSVSNGSTTSSSLNPTNTSGTNTTTTSQEGDVGAGGAMLGGTGIAEVVLPVEERIQTARKTEEAASELNKRRWDGSVRRLPGVGISGGGGMDGAGFGASMVLRRDDTNDSGLMRDCLPVSFGQGPGKQKNKKRSLSPSSASFNDLPLSNRPCTVPRSTNTNTTNNDDDGNTSTRPTTIVNNNTNDLPSYYPPATSAAERTIRSEDVSHIGSSYAHNYSLHNHEWISNRKREQQVELDVIQKEKEQQEGSGLNRMRVGFEAKRGLIQNGGGGSGGYTGGTNTDGRKLQGGYGGGGSGGGGRPIGSGGGRARDNQAWKNFISKERDRGLNR